MSPHGKNIAITLLGLLDSYKSSGLATLDRPFPVFDYFAEEIGCDSDDIESVLEDFLMGMGYVTSYKYDDDILGYKISALGRTYLQENSSLSVITSTNNITNSGNLAINSTNFSQSIDLSDPEVKDLLLQLQSAKNGKDKSAILKILGYIGDKSVDLLIAMLSGGLINE